MVEADIIQKEIHALIIGDEILSGKREDKHLAHLIKTLKSLTNSLEIKIARQIYCHFLFKKR